MPCQPQRPTWPRVAAPVSSQQIGVVGSIDFLPAGSADNDADRDRLHIEWWGQQGRTRLVLIEPQVEFLSAMPEAWLWTEADEQDQLPDLLPESAWDWSAAMWVSPAEMKLEAEMAEDESWNTRPCVIPIRDLLSPPLELPTHLALDPERLWKYLQRALARLAEIGVALRTCEHLSVRDVYRVVAERLLTEVEIEPALMRMYGAESISTSYFCPHCQKVWRLYEDDLPPGAGSQL